MENSLSKLYLGDQDNKFTIANIYKNPNFKGRITFSWDPHGGLYFSGLESDLVMLSKLISEDTILITG